MKSLCQSLHLGHRLVKALGQGTTSVSSKVSESGSVSLQGMCPLLPFFDFIYSDVNKFDVKQVI